MSAMSELDIERQEAAIEAGPPESDDTRTLIEEMQFLEDIERVRIIMRARLRAHMTARKTRSVERDGLRARLVESKVWVCQCHQVVSGECETIQAYVRAICDPVVVDPYLTVRRVGPVAE